MKTTYSHSEFTVFEGITVTASEHGGTPVVTVTFPDQEWDTATVIRSFGNLNEAKLAGMEIATRLKAFCPKGYTGFLGPRLSAKKPEMVAARERVEAEVREWALN